MTSFTFKINGADFSDCVNKYGYTTGYSPVAGKSVTTMDGIDHVSITRYRGSLQIEVNPQTDSRYKELCTALNVSPLEITYHSYQRNADVTESMRLDSVSSGLGLINSDRTIIDTMRLSFTQL